MRALLLVLLVSGAALGQTAAGARGTNTGNVTLDAVGSSPNANGASLSGASGQVFKLQPASQTLPGAMTAGAQDIGGAKTFYSNVTCSACSLIAGSKLIGDTVETNTATSLTLNSTMADGATAVGVISKTNATWANTAAKIHSFKNNTTEYAYVGYKGGITFLDATVDAQNLVLPVNTRICFNAACSVWVAANGGADMNFQSVGRMLTNSVKLGLKDLTVYTCSSDYEGAVISDTLRGVSTGNATSMCQCRSSGAGAYAYQNLKTGWVGTSSTCPSDESASVSGALDFGSIAAGATAELTQNLTGAVATDKVSCAYPTALEANLSFSCRAGAGIITYRIGNHQLVGAVDPASGTFGATVAR